MINKFGYFSDLRKRSSGEADLAETDQPFTKLISSAFTLKVHFPATFALRQSLLLECTHHHFHCRATKPPKSDSFLSFPISWLEVEHGVPAEGLEEDGARGQKESESQKATS